MCVKLTDIISFDVLRDLVESLWKSSGLPTRFVDVEGNILASSGYREFPYPYRSNVDTRPAGTPSPFSQTDFPFETIGLPVVVGGMHLADISICQFFHAPPDENVLRQQASRFGLDEEDYLSMLRDMPVVSRERVGEILVCYEMAIRLLAVLFSDIAERKEREAELFYRQRFEALLAGISTRCMELGNARLDQAIDLALGDLGEFARIDRAYLFLFSETGERMSNTHEWCAPGIAPEKDHLQNLAVADFSWIAERICNGELVHIPRVAELPPEAVEVKGHLAAQGIRSLLSIPVYIHGRVAGFIGFDAVRTEKAWEERDMALLRTVGEIIGSALERRKIADALEYRLRLEGLIAKISTHMVNLEPDAVDAAIESALRDIGQFVGSDRSYVFLFAEDGKSMHNTHEWTAPGISSCKTELSHLPSSAFPWFLRQLRRREFVFVPEVAKLGAEAAQEKAEWLREDIRSLLCLPIGLGDRLLGFIGFDGVRQATAWSKEVVLLMKIVGECFANALERRRNDRSLREQKEQLQAALQETEAARDKIGAILRSIKAGLLVTDREGRILLMNRTAEELLVRSAASVLGRPAGEVISEPALCEQIFAVLEGKENLSPVEWDFGHPCSPRVIQAHTDRMIGSDGRPGGSITMLYDVSREREIDRMKNEFISTAAHELRTPLTSVMGYSELLLEQGFFGTFTIERQQEFLREIHTKAGDLAEIIDDLLNLSRVESGQLVRLHRRQERLDLLLQEIIHEFRHLHPQFAFEVSLASALPPLGLDRSKIRQVMENLLGNAVKFSTPGGVVRVAAAAKDGEIRVEIEDSGIGMTTEQLQHIFDKFYRGDMSDTAVGGLGLGMTIVKNIIDAHGGYIRVESTLGQGTRVTFTLPVAGMSQALQ